jgi:hypothetical protein
MGLGALPREREETMYANVELLWIINLEQQEATVAVEATCQDPRIKDFLQSFKGHLISDP